MSVTSVACTFDAIAVFGLPLAMHATTLRSGLGLLAFNPSPSSAGQMGHFCVRLDLSKLDALYIKQEGRSHMHISI